MLNRIIATLVLIAFFTLAWAPLDQQTFMAAHAMKVGALPVLFWRHRAHTATSD